MYKYTLYSHFLKPRFLYLMYFSKIFRLTKFKALPRVIFYASFVPWLTFKENLILSPPPKQNYFFPIINGGPFYAGLYNAPYKKLTPFRAGKKRPDEVYVSSFLGNTAS